MSSKLMENNRRAHAAKVLAKSSKKNQEQPEDTEVEKTSKTTVKSKKTMDALNDQYQIIRGDILKLREDLSHGYDLLKDFIQVQISRRTFVKFNKT